MKLLVPFLLILSFATLAQTEEECPITDLKPNAVKWDFNFMGCYNYYAVDLGQDAANAKCKKLSKIQDFSEKNFAKCNELFQPSRSEWKAAIADRCIELAKKHKFLTPSFSSCIDAFAITHSGRTDKEKKLAIESAAKKCMTFSEKVDYTSKSFIRCFSFSGGNHWPGGKAEAASSLEIAAQCTELVQKYDFSTEKMYECWDNNRIKAPDRRKMVEDCAKQ